MIVLAAGIITAGCSTGGTEDEPAEETTEVQEETDTMEDTERMTDVNENTVTGASLPEELAQIPEKYLEPSDQPGTLTELEYDTYESMTYEDQSQVLHKRAIVLSALWLF